MTFSNFCIQTQFWVSFTPMDSKWQALQYEAKFHKILTIWLLNIILSIWSLLPTVSILDPKRITFSYWTDEGIVHSLSPLQSIWALMDVYFETHPKIIIFLLSIVLVLFYQGILEKSLQYLEFEHSFLDLKSKKVHTILIFQH